MEVHLVLVYLPLVQNLIDKDEQPVGIALDGLYITLALVIRGNMLLEFLQRTYNKCQWRLYVVCGIYEETHLRLFQFCLLAP